jgi:hypothetical protein
VLIVSAPLALRRRLPELVALVIALVFGIGAMLGVGDGFFSSICLYLAIYAVGAWSQNPLLSRWMRLSIIAGMFIWLFWQLIGQANQATAMPDLSRDRVFSTYAAFGMLQVLINLLYSWAVGMPLRIFTGAAEWWEPLLSLVILVLSTLVVIVLRSRIYSNSLLRMGARVSLRDALKR